MLCVRRELEAKLALLKVAGVGPKRFEVLCSHFGSAQAVLARSSRHLVEAGVPEKLSHAISRASYEDARRALTWCHANGIKIWCRSESHYPERLRHIADPPALLFGVGEARLDERPCIAIVGARRASTHGVQFAKRLGADLADAGFDVVSGLAYGIDAAAHEGALYANGSTLAVMGTGIDCVYPSAHRKLSRAIRESGLLLSEYLPGTPPHASHFPRRNRIVSGLSVAVVVVQAGARSGSLITARLGLEQGRVVGAVPGMPGVSHHAGTNELLRQGALLVRHADDILEEIAPQLERRASKQSEAIFGQSVPDEHRPLAELLLENSCHTDEIANYFNKPAEVVRAELTALEISGFIRRSQDGLWTWLLRIGDPDTS